MLKRFQPRPLLAIVLLAPAALAEPENAEPENADPYLWLEDIRGDRALDWVNEQNARTLERLTGDPRYERIYQDTLDDLTRGDRLPQVQVIGDYVYDLLQNAGHVRGLWRRIPVADFVAGKDDWQPVLDIDALGQREHASWVFRGATCFEPEGKRCLLALSPGGSDAAEYREFDLERKAFVREGFRIPEVKANVAWRDRDSLLVSAAIAGDDATLAGYGRKLRLWQRGTALADAPVVFEVPAGHVGVWPIVEIDGERRHVLVADLVTIFDPVLHVLEKDATTVQLPLPAGFNLLGVTAGQLYGRQKEEWAHDGRTLRAGTLLAFPVEPMLEDGKFAAEIVFEPSESQAVDTLLGTGTVDFGDTLYFALNEHVIGKLMRARWTGEEWQVDAVEFPDNGAVSIVAGHADTATVIVRYENPTTPPTLYAIEDAHEPRSLMSLEARFNPSKFETVQYFATSKDGTRVPYFVTRPVGLELDGSAPALVGAYGGFGVTIKPVYMAMFGSGAPFKNVLLEGGVYVLANIRGGGEYGPGWHQGAIRENRQRVYEDFYAVAEDLIARGYTSSDRLGITGMSNSGLLVGVAMTQRPDLYAAVSCGIPLLDMRRYHKLLAGASWMAEYGNPDEPDEWSFIRAYSPYHNVRPDVEYPEVLFWGSTRDDRVHPGHARKMAALMMDQGHPVLFYEETEGGHGSADLNQQARLEALHAVYLLQKLFR